jgi:hypothetical protein
MLLLLGAKCGHRVESRCVPSRQNATARCDGENGEHNDHEHGGVERLAESDGHLESKEREA